MAQEENALSIYSSYTPTEEDGGASASAAAGSFCSGGGLSSRSKKGKQKKTPQRGLGVAQLERIRLEEQHKRESLQQSANVLSNNSVISDLALQFPNYRATLNLSSNSNGVPSDKISSPTILFGSNPSIPTIESKNQSSVQISKNVNGGEMGILSPRNGNWPRFYNLDNHGFVFRHGQVNSPYEGNLSERSHQFQHVSASSSSMVNAPCGISPCSILSSQMEPPSNQNFHGNNNYRPSWNEEDKMVGMKRSYPFSLETPPSPSFQNRHICPTLAVFKSRADELVSNGHTSHIEPTKQYIREGPSRSSEVIQDNERLNGDFLTLAPPASASPHSNSKHKNHSYYSDVQEVYLSDSEDMSGQEPEQRGMSKEQTFSFFPVKSQAEQSTILVNNGKGGRGDTIDLNLRL